MLKVLESVSFVDLVTTIELEIFLDCMRFLNKNLHTHLSFLGEKIDSFALWFVEKYLGFAFLSVPFPSYEIAEITGLAYL
jgi:hypothetical protein